MPEYRNSAIHTYSYAYRHLVGCVQSELSAVMPHFFADKDDTSHESEDSPTVSEAITISSSGKFPKKS